MILRIASIRKSIYIVIICVCSFFLLNSFLLNQSRSKKKQTWVIKIEPKRRFVEFECSTMDTCGGWGDRLKGIFSAYALALITNREFLIQATKNCDLANILVPNEVNWDYKQIRNLRANFSQENLTIGWDYPFIDKLKEIDPFTLNENADIINIKTGIMFGDSFAYNKYVRSRLEQLGYEQEKFKIYYHMRKWYSKLFKLNMNMQKRYTEIYNKLKPNNMTQLICAQIRIGDPGHVTESEPNIQQDYWKFINETFLSKSSDPSIYKIYVTSDREYAKQEALRYFPKNEIFFNPNTSVHVEKDFSNQTNLVTECNAMENVLLDFHILQNCDIGLVGHSGFGIMAMWNRDEPFKDVYVYTQKDQNKMKNDYFNRKNLTFVRYSKFEDVYFL